MLGLRLGGGVVGSVCAQAWLLMVINSIAKDVMKIARASIAT